MLASIFVLEEAASSNPLDGLVLKHNVSSPGRGIFLPSG